MTTLPFTSVTVAEKVAVPALPPAAIESDAGVTTTLPTGGLIEIVVTEPLLPSLVAVMRVEPTVSPETRPVELTVATPGVPDCHVTVRPVSTPPTESLVTADNCVV